MRRCRGIRTGQSSQWVEMGGREWEQALSTGSGTGGASMQGCRAAALKLEQQKPAEALPETRLGEAPGVPGLGCLKLPRAIFNQFPDEQIVPGTTLRGVDVGVAVPGYFLVQWRGLLKATKGEEDRGEEGKCG